MSIYFIYILCICIYLSVSFSIPCTSFTIHLDHFPYVLKDHDKNVGIKDSQTSMKSYFSNQTYELNCTVF